MVKMCRDGAGLARGNLIGGRIAAIFVTVLLAACGGGRQEDAGVPFIAAATTTSASSCDAGPRKAGLRQYFDEWYLWYPTSPKPDPGGSASLADFFDALLNTGTETTPADRWSYYSRTADFERFFADGQTQGYGVMVNGLEAIAKPGTPLFVRYVEPGSPAELAGVRRGDRIVTVNGQAAAELIAGGDFSVLSPQSAGEALTLQINANGSPIGARSVSLRSAEYALVPVTGTQVLSSPLGRRVGYLSVKDMVSQALTPVADAMTAFRTAGVTELVVDLRYNGGGLVSVGRDIASLIAGARGNGSIYASLRYNDKQAAAYDIDFNFGNPAQGLGLQRVYILAGERTCSASEQLAVGLRGVLDVVLVGNATCGKPVGFNPADDGCGLTFSVVNFESTNGRGEGRYYNGLRPQCAASEDWTQPLGAVAEPLLAVALAHADGAACAAPATTAARPRALSAATVQRVLRSEGERPGMIVR